MNRLILIGNGFDLAHGIPTRYNDFLLGYLKRAFVEAGKGKNYQDKLMMIDAHLYSEQIGNRGGLPQTTDELLDYCYQNGFLEELLYKRKVPFGSQDVFTNFTVNIHSDFFKFLLTKCKISNWVEIENEFYFQLSKIVQMQDEHLKEKALRALNESMDGLIKALQKYLSTIECKAENSKYENILRDFISLKEIPLVKLEGYTQPQQTMILNFNYTSTINRYVERLDKSLQNTIKINNIHGTLSDPDNPMVFGFGDELDEYYSLMEKSRIKGFFKYIKSFWYFRTENYHDLIRFIESDSYEVVILGHSCGLSDRTMLNMVFEHENCRSIRIYYYENGIHNNFNELTEEIARHFSNKTSLRAKVIPKPKCVPMPQAPVSVHQEVLSVGKPVS
ncbi:AbiH family protein [Chitinophaga cymbidii]|uniref:Bacteriophage abortive infection AbiH n=1 Tax=Chitinophaga cymbidii TaxID=1096750 RepID=A0A512RFL3_9BACT|nr:AbiH family protein [Chitinophaga cymbidii]GEP94507.1 hypothetical protein CCY01nite_07670 [Chitinophaga cymbidii]